MNRFLSSKSIFIITILWSLVLFMIVMMVYSYFKTDISIAPIVIISLACALIIWILLDTRYVIRNGNLLYRSGPFRGRINIEKINSVKYFSGLYVPVNMKPALDTKGFIITYNQFDDVYVSPKETENFLTALLKVNPTIVVKR